MFFSNTWFISVNMLTQFHRTLNTKTFYTSSIFYSGLDFNFKAGEAMEGKGYFSYTGTPASDVVPKSTTVLLLRERPLLC